MKKVFIDSDMATGVNALHEHLMDVLELPGYYGKNLDALYECLTDISEDVRIVLPMGFEQVLNGYGQRVITVIHDAAEYNSHVHPEFL